MAIFKYIIFIVLTLLFVDSTNNVCHAQLFSNRNNANGGLNNTLQNNMDSSRNKQLKTNDSIQIFYFTYQDTTHKKLDSTIDLAHRSPLLNVWESDLGNFASSATSLYFNPTLSPKNKMGIFSDTVNHYTLNHVKFYNTTRPFTNLFYRLGTKQEQIVEISHTRNVNSGWNIALAYRKAGSPGSYKLQRTNNDNAMLNTHYNSQNRQYQIKGTLLYNKIQQDENGGIQNEELLFYNNYNNKRLVPVNFDPKAGETNRSNMTNYHRDLVFNIEQQYFVGKKDSVLSADSAETIYTFQPVFGLKHHLYTSHSLYQFKDRTPDSIYYTRLDNFSFTSKDSMFISYRLGSIGNAFSLLGNILFKQKVLQAEAGYGIEIDQASNVTFKESYLNNYLFCHISKPLQQNEKWLYNASLKFYLTGNLIGNTLLSASATRTLSERFGQVGVNFDQAIQNAPFLFQEINANFYSIKTSLNKQTISKLQVRYVNALYKTRLNLNYYLLANYFYRDTTLDAKQYSKALPLIQAELIKKLHYRKLFLDNQVLLQLISSNAPIKLPLFAAVSKLSYENKILKKKLNIATGIECRYNTPFLADQYAPIFYSFVTQYERKIANVPCFTYFFNFKVRTFRGTVSFDQIQQLFTRNNINYSLYPAQNFMVRFGFNWSFIN